MNWITFKCIHTLTAKIIIVCAIQLGFSGYFSIFFFKKTK